MKTGQNIFLLVNDAQDKNKVLSDLVRYSAEVKVKTLDPRAPIGVVSPRDINGQKVLCKVMGSLSFASQAQELITQFHLAEQKYICQLNSVLRQDILELDFSSALYKVQRREDFRLRLPAGYQGRLTIQINGRKIKCKLVDISAGGCRIEIPPDLKWEVGNTFKGVLSTLMRDDLDVELTVRHVGKAGAKDTIRSVGAQFTNQTEIVKNRMAALVMDLYREFFTKRA